MEAIKFKQGIYKMNRQPNFDFQLNRLIMWDGGRLEDVEAVAARITDSHSWKRELIGLGDTAMADGRTENAIAYYRMSEFFMVDGDPDKLKYYTMATDLFYEFYAGYFTSGIVEQIRVAYEDICLPVMHAIPEGRPKDRILLHGGNDSYFEELFFPMLYFREKGYEVYLMEGPGQGGVLRLQGKHFTHRWEMPVKAILDETGLEDITIIGASLGGMLAPRAAAFEKRIGRVIAWSIFPSFLHAVFARHTQVQRHLIQWLLRYRVKVPVNLLLKKIMAKEATADWAVRHGMYAYQAKTPFDYLKKLEQFQMLDIAGQITQDILVLGAADDHFIPPSLYKEELDALTEVRSLTYRLFTARESASNHCNAGNSKLCLDTMMSWIEQMKGRE